MSFFNSIRARLQIWYGLILLVILTGFGFTAWQLDRGHLFGRLNGELERRGVFLATAMQHHPGRPEEGGPGMGGPDEGGPPPDRPPPGEFPDGRPPEDGGGPPGELRLPPETAGLFAADDPNNFYFIIYRRDGDELRRSTNAPARPLNWAELSAGFPEEDHERDHERPPLPPRQFGDREEILKQLPRGEAIVVGCSIKPELVELRLVALRLAAVGGMVLLLGLAGGWWLAGRAIRPIADISATAIKIAAGDLSQRISVAETENELGRLAAVLNSTFARLEAAFAQQKEFTSDAAHELRTPVTVMLTQTQMSLGRERSPAEYRQTLEACQRAAQRMRRLIESLLALARLDAGQEPMKRLNFDLAELIRDCADLVRPLAEERGVTLALDVQPLEARGDAERIAQVVTNLLTNAIQYNRPNGEVRVAAELQNDVAVITVRDTGLGIAAEDLPRVFERFYRSDKSRSTGGNGLGLAICQAIIEAHGGAIEVTSEVGVGAAFTVRLPVA